MAEATLALAAPDTPGGKKEPCWLACVGARDGFILGRNPADLGWLSGRYGDCVDADERKVFHGNPRNTHDLEHALEHEPEQSHKHHHSLTNPSLWHFAGRPFYMLPI
eukprot:2203991-Prymnesium_polylepis.1